MAKAEPPWEAQGYITLAQAAALIPASRSTPYKWAKTGRLRTVPWDGKMLTKPEWVEEAKGNVLWVDPPVEERRHPLARWAIVAVLAVFAFVAGNVIDEVWKVEWHPVGLDIDRGFAMLVVALGAGAAVYFHLRPRLVAVE